MKPHPLPRTRPLPRLRATLIVAAIVATTLAASTATLTVPASAAPPPSQNQTGPGDRLGDPVVRGTEHSIWYIAGSEKKVTDDEADHMDDVLTNPAFAGIDTAPSPLGKGDANVARVSGSPTNYVLKGDSASMVGGYAQAQQYTMVGVHPTGDYPELTDENARRHLVFSPKQDYWGPVQNSDLADGSFEWLTGNTRGSNDGAGPNTECADSDPRAGYDGSGAITPTIWDAWCVGIGVWVYRYADLEPKDPDNFETPYNAWFGLTYPNSFAHGSQEMRYLSGPLNQDLGGINTFTSEIFVLDPVLDLTKEVCSTVTGCAAADDSLWVDRQTIPPGTTEVQWRLTATNAGNVPLTDIHVARDTTEAQVAAEQAQVGVSDCAALEFDPLDPGESQAKTCTTALSGLFEGDIVNTATLNGSFSDAWEKAPGYIEQIVDPHGDSLLNRFTGNPDDQLQEPAPVGWVPSNVAQAVVREPNPAVILSKWVCGTGQECNVPGGDDLKLLATENPTGGWAKQATVPYDTSARWLLVVTNTGNTPLIDVRFAVENQTGGSHGDTTGECAEGALVATRILEGDSVAVTCSTSNIRNSAAWGSGEDVINYAQAQGVATDAAGVPLSDGVLLPDGTFGVLTVASGTAWAEVNTTAPTPGLSLEKWVCQAGTGCAVPTGSDLGDLATGVATADWDKTVTVEYGTAAQWLLVVENT
ncbi:MAG: hypothetical protein LBS56_08630, partial [Propionibacteriaceae bacterium]|nr:hypothetical protein [Propionibacteriaceae bacterium]